MALTARRRYSMTRPLTGRRWRPSRADEETLNPNMRPPLLHAISASAKGSRTQRRLTGSSKLTGQVFGGESGAGPLGAGAVEAYPAP